MTMSDLHQSLVTASLDAVVKQASDARNASDLDAMRKALNAVWFATHQAQEAVTAAERETRREALAQLEPAA